MEAKQLTVMDLMIAVSQCKGHNSTTSSYLLPVLLKTSPYLGCFFLWGTLSIWYWYDDDMDDVGPCTLSGVYYVIRSLGYLAVSSSNLVTPWVVHLWKKHRFLLQKNPSGTTEMTVEMAIFGLQKSQKVIFFHPNSQPSGGGGHPPLQISSGEEDVPQRDGIDVGSQGVRCLGGSRAGWGPPTPQDLQWEILGSVQDDSKVK